MFAFQDTRGAVEVAFTDRHAGGRPGSGVGSAGGPGAELNLLAREVGEARVEDNLALVARALGGDAVRGVALMRQVHGSEVAVVTGVARPEPPEADGLVTAVAGWVLASRAADCVPVLIADPARRVVGAVHAGRAGVAAGVVSRAVEALRGLGAEELVAWVGPHACGRCYEVPDQLRAEVASAVPETWAETSWGTPALDLGAGVGAQLAAEGAEVVDVGRCTIEDADFFSYRRQGARAGRHAGLIWVHP